MFKKQGSLFLGVSLALLLALGACKSKFEKLKASSDNPKKYQEAIKYYNKKEYSKALELFDELAQKYRGRDGAEDLFYYYAYTNYKLKDYTSARYQFKQFAENYGNSPRAEECRFMAAYCFYLDSPVFSLDQENTTKAIEALQLFINLYPKSDRVAEASKLIQNLRDKLEEKAYANAKLYSDIGDYQAAVIAFGNAVRDYPDTKYAEEMDFLTIKAQYMYARNSSELKQEDRYTQAISFADQFLEKYPQSKFVKDANDLKKDSQNGIDRAKNVIAQAMNDQRKARKLARKDTTAVKTQVQSVDKNVNEKSPQ